MPKIISVIGSSKSGKTTIIEKLISELKNNGYKIGTIKHTHHDINIDQEGKDTFRHKIAGADTVVLVSSNKIFMIKDDDKPKLENLIIYFNDVDILLVEGFKKENIPKILVVRKEAKEQLLEENNNIFAIVTNLDKIDFMPDIPRICFEDINKLLNIIIEKIV